MADFNEDQINQVAQQIGATPDFVRSQLQAEGHNVLATPAPAFPAAQDMGNAKPMAPERGQWFGSMGAQGPMSGSQDPSAPTNTTTEMALQAAQAPKTTPGAQQRPQGIRATGQFAQGFQPPPAQQPAMLGSASKVRKLMDAREKGIATEYMDAAQQYQESSQRLGDLQKEAFGFEQDRLNKASQRADEASAMYSELGAKNDEAIAKEADARLKEDGVLATQADKLLQLRNDAANEKLQERSWGSRLGAAFSVALAGIGDAIVQASGKGRADAAANTMAMVNAAIDRDVQEQLRQIQEKKGAATAFEQRLQDLRSSIGDDRAFRSMARSYTQEAFANRMEGLAARANSEEAKLTASSAATEFRKAAEASANEALGLATKETRDRLRNAADQRFSFEVGQAMPRPAPGSGKKDDKEPLKGVTGLRQIADATTEDRKGAQAVMNGASNVLGTIDQLVAMAERGKTLSPDQRNIARRRIAALKSQFNGTFGDGTAPNEAQLEALDEMFVNPTEVSWGDAKVQFQAFKQDALDLTNGKLRTFNYTIDDGGSNSFREE